MKIIKVRTAAVGVALTTLLAGASECGGSSRPRPDPTPGRTFANYALDVMCDWWDQSGEEGVNKDTVEGNRLARRPGLPSAIRAKVLLYYENLGRGLADTSQYRNVLNVCRQEGWDG